MNLPIVFDYKEVLELSLFLAKEGILCNEMDVHIFGRGPSRNTLNLREDWQIKL